MFETELYGKTYVLRRKSASNIEIGTGKRLSKTGVADPVRKSREGGGMEGELGGRLRWWR